MDMVQGDSDAERDGVGTGHDRDNGVLLADDLTRTYGETRALDGVSLAVETGEVFCCIGPNGAGKTTLVRALCGTTDPEGEVEIFDSPPTEVDRSRVGLLPRSSPRRHASPPVNCSRTTPGSTRRPGIPRSYSPISGWRAARGRDTRTSRGASDGGSVSGRR